MCKQNGYDQGYYYGNQSYGGLDVYNCSEKKEIMLKSISKRSREFDSELPAEYTEYSDSCKCICYIGVIKIDQGEYNLRYDTLHHIFIPAEPSDINNPYSYIRYLLPYYYNSAKSLRSPLSRIEVPKISEILEMPEISESKEESDELLYHRLLSYCRLDGEENRKKFARLLELAYGIMFRNKKAAVILPDSMFAIDRNIPKDMGDEPQNCYQFAAALMLILHLLAPDCFSSFNSQDKLRMNLMHSVVKNTLYKKGLCFIRQSDACEKANIDCPVIDIYHDSCDEYPQDNFYYVLAEEAQVSIHSMKHFLDTMCEMKGVQKFPCKRLESQRDLALDSLLEIYNSYLPRRRIKDSSILITLDSYKEIVSFDEKKVYYKEYIQHLFKFKSHGQLSDDDSIILGFWKEFKTEKFRDVDSTVFLLEECKTDDTFIQLLNDVISRDDIRQKLSESKELHLWEMIDKISDTDGLKYLSDIKELLENIGNTEDILYKAIKGKTSEKSKSLYRLLSQNADRKKCCFIIESAGLLSAEELDSFIYENTVVGDDPQTVQNQKKELDIKNRHDKSVLRKIYSVSFQRFSQFFRQDETNNNIENRETVTEYKKIFTELAKYFSDNENFANEIAAEEKYYKKYDIQHANHFNEMKDVPEDDIELMNCKLSRLANILLNLNAEQDNDLTEMKSILGWNTVKGGKLAGLEAYDKFKQSIERIYEHFVKAAYDTKNYKKYLSDADSINDDTLKNKMWDSISWEDFRNIVGYSLPKPLLKHIRTYLFSFYNKFKTEDISKKTSRNPDAKSEIQEFVEIFSNDSSFKDEITAFMQFNDIKDMCRQSTTAMTNYCGLAELFDTPHRVIYENFNGEVPTGNMTDKVYLNTKKYEYMMQYPKDGENTSTSPKMIDISLLDANEKETFLERMKKHIRSRALFFENSIFDSENKTEAFEKWEEFLRSIDKVQNVITGIDSLKKEFIENLFDRLLETRDKVYVEMAENLSVDELKKQELERIKADLKEQERQERERKRQEEEKQKVNQFENFQEIEQSLGNGEITFSEFLWERIRVLLNKENTFLEDRAWIMIFSQYAGEKQEAEFARCKLRESIQAEVDSGNFKNFWLLFADEKNFEFLSEFWKNIECKKEMFNCRYSTLPKGYTIDKMSSDIFGMTSKSKHQYVKINLFILYVIFKNGCTNAEESDLLERQKNVILHKCSIDDKEIKEKNLESLAEILLFTIDECAESIVKSAKEYAKTIKLPQNIHTMQKSSKKNEENKKIDLFRICFELADALEDKFPHIHIDMARVFDKDSKLYDKSPQKFMVTKVREFDKSAGVLEPQYKDLTVLEKTLKFILIQYYISKNVLDDKEDASYMNQLAIEAYKDDTLLTDEYKDKLKECWLKFISDSDKSKGTLSKRKKKIISDIKEALGIPNEPSSNTYETINDNVELLKYLKNYKSTENSSETEEE